MPYQNLITTLTAEKAKPDSYMVSTRILTSFSKFAFVNSREFRRALVAASLTSLLCVCVWGGGGGGGGGVDWYAEDKV